jgi:hypothetical protein
MIRLVQKRKVCINVHFCNKFLLFLLQNIVFFMESVDKLIEKNINNMPKGTLFFPEDFSDYGSSGAVRLCLHRLTEKGQIRRVAKGIYVIPEISELVGEVIPTAEEVAYAIAKRDKARIIPTGIYALNALGLSTQIPMKAVYLTDGSPRLIKIGKRTILFKKASPKNLAVQGKISSLVIQALKQIGDGFVREDEEKRIIEILKKEEKEKLKYDIKLAPVWIAKHMKKALL